MTESRSRSLGYPQAPDHPTNSRSRTSVFRGGDLVAAIGGQPVEKGREIITHRGV